MADFATLVAALGREAGLDVNWSPVSPVDFELDGLTVTILSDRRSGAEEIILYSRLGEIPEARELAVYRVLLEANVLWSATGDATLGVNSSTREAIMCFRMTAADLTPPGFIAAVSGFAELARSWSAFIAAPSDDEVEPPAGATSLSFIRG